MKSKTRLPPPPEERAWVTPTDPISIVNDNQDCDLQVRERETDQGEAGRPPSLKSAENDPIVLDLQVRGTGATQEKAVHPPLWPMTVDGRIPPGIPTGPKITPRESLCVLDGGRPGEVNGVDPWMHNANYTSRNCWWRESHSEEGSVPDPGSKLDDYPDPGSELDDYPDSDSELDDYADDSDLNASLDAEEDPDPDGPEAEIRAIFNMHNPTTLFAGRLTRWQPPDHPPPLSLNHPITPSSLVLLYNQPNHGEGEELESANTSPA